MLLNVNNKKYPKLLKIKINQKMVRRCCVGDCRETDLSILAHRFPKSQNNAINWQKALKLEKIPIVELQKGNFVVCTKHFKESDYRNVNSNCLNITAIPNTFKNNDNERIINTREKNGIPKLLKDMKCHKLPSNLTLKLVGTSEPNPSSNNHPKKPKISEESEIEIEPLQNELEEYIEEEIEEDNATIEFLDERPKIYSTIIFQQQSTMTDRIELKDQEVQTSPEQQLLKEQQSNSSDKDDKIIKLLYPDFANYSKIDLVKMLIEKNLKIKSLIEKEKQLEDALANLL